MSPCMEPLTEATARQILDYDQKLDITLLDRVIQCMYNGQGEEQKMAEKILTAMKEDGNSWTRVDAILEYSQSQQTKYFALQILENVIKIRWKVLPREQCEGIKKYIVGLIIKISSEPISMGEQSVFLGKLNLILVQILKHEWPKNWTTFISDIVGSSRTNESLCQNNLTILKLLSEEVFDFSAGQLTQVKAKHLKDSMCAEFSTIFELCQFVLRNSRTAPLVASTLETLLKFMHWIPLGYIFETDLITMLIKNFLSVPLFRNTTLKCLTEIAAISEPKYEIKFIELCCDSTEELNQMLPCATPIRDSYHLGTDDEQKFIQNLALFYSTLLRVHAPLLEAHMSEVMSHHEIALKFLLRISEVDDTEIFKICLEYWNHLCAVLYRDAFTLSNILYNTAGQDGLGCSKRTFYNPILSALRRIIISRMARPEEVLIIENDQGEVVREFMKDTDSINLYKTMRETLVYLTHLDQMDTQLIMNEKMTRIVSGYEWSWKNLNTLCWAIGSVSGAFPEDDERRFLVVTVRELLGLCEEKKGKDNKAIVASNIMYVVGQYPRFLRAHWRFLKTVVTKLFEFMHETHEGVQDMACDTFIKIAHKCKRQFVTVQVGEVRTFVEDIIQDLNATICDLQPQQVQTFYEAVAIMISAHTDQEMREKLVEQLYYPANRAFEIIIAQATHDIESLRDPNVVRQLKEILQTNISGCKALSTSFMSQLGRIYLDMLNVYKVMSSNINQVIASHGEETMKQPLIRSMRTVKKEILRLIYIWVQSIGKKVTFLEQIAENFLPPLLEAVLIDYQHNIPAAREPEVLHAMAILVNELGVLATPSVPNILDAVFQCTLEMINRDMAEYPDHRTYFFSLLEAVNANCFSAFLQLDQVRFKLLLDSVIWAIKHTMRHVSETGLNVLHRMLLNITEILPAQRQNFYQAFYLDILSHMFAVVTDSSQTGNLTLQCSILAHMFEIVESGTVTAPLISDGTVTSSENSNIQIVYHSLSQLLKQAFPHLQDAQIRLFIDGLFSYDHDLNAFRGHVRDFLVQIREIAGEDLSDLYLEEQEEEMRKAQEKKREIELAVPGLLGPHHESAMEDVKDS